MLAAVSEPLGVDRRSVDGRDTPLETFGVGVAAIVSLMLVTMLLASGLLALERQDNTLRRLVRGLVRPFALLSEKALVAGACGLLVALLLLAVVGIFVPLEWSRFGLWVAGARVRRARVRRARHGARRRRAGGPGLVAAGVRALAAARVPGGRARRARSRRRSTTSSRRSRRRSRSSRRSMRSPRRSATARIGGDLAHLTLLAVIYGGWRGSACGGQRERPAADRERRRRPRSARSSSRDAAELLAVRSASREHLAPWEPSASESYFTEAAQRARLEADAERLGGRIAASRSPSSTPLTGA